MDSARRGAPFASRTKRWGTRRGKSAREARQWLVKKRAKRASEARRLEEAREARRLGSMLTPEVLI